jgi:hypothetical protein
MIEERLLVRAPALAEDLEQRVEVRVAGKLAASELQVQGGQMGAREMVREVRRRQVEDVLDQPHDSQPRIARMIPG